jgi:hypothetical protein
MRLGNTDRLKVRNGSGSRRLGKRLLLTTTPAGDPRRALSSALSNGRAENRHPDIRYGREADVALADFLLRSVLAVAVGAIGGPVSAMITVGGAHAVGAQVRLQACMASIAGSVRPEVPVNRPRSIRVVAP